MSRLLRHLLKCLMIRLLEETETKVVLNWLDRKKQKYKYKVQLSKRKTILQPLIIVLYARM